MSAYPLYDVPYLVRDPNEFRMSEKRHEIEVKNQAVVDDYYHSETGVTQHHLVLSRSQKTKKVRFFGKIRTIRGTLNLISYYLCTVFQLRGGVLVV